MHVINQSWTSVSDRLNPVMINCTESQTDVTIPIELIINNIDVCTCIIIVIIFRSHNYFYILPDDTIGRVKSVKESKILIL